MMNISAQTEINIETAGSLPDILKARNIQIESVKELKLSGVADSRDFKTIALAINSLEKIDISMLRIEPYNSTPSRAFTNFTKLQTVFYH